ncbi:MAG: 16S rRNA (cytidine(1402)-2'-O)-methyltransferase [Bacteroidota bacterium]
MDQKGKLVLVPTPIGNLGDITIRALEVLKSADRILAEDTRKTGSLLKKYSIDNQMISYHAHNEHRKTESLVEEMIAGAKFALTTDAGTPGISDPGFLLVRSCVEKEIEVECLPGATAFVPALVNSGLPCDRFIFEGFLPHKKGRQTRIDKIKEEERTVVLYESPHRIIKTLEQLSNGLGPERKVSVSRELSKMYEENVRGSFTEVLEHFKNGTVKGEFVIIVAGK